MFNYESNKYRLSSIQFTDSTIAIAGKGCARFSDFEAIWNTLTFTDFTSVALDPSVAPNEALTFNEFSVIPLMEAQ